MDKNLIFQWQTFPASEVGLSNSGLTQFRKELIKVGSYTHPATKEAFEVTKATLTYWAKTFSRWVNNGGKIPIPPGHDKASDPKENQGWVTKMFVEGESLFGVLELIEPKLAFTTDVSISVPVKTIDSKGNVYKSMIDHVALCVDPVISGLENFVKLSLSIGESEMEIWKTIAEKLGYKGEVTKELVLSALDKKIKPEKKVELSNKVDPLVKLVSENRALKLSNLVKAGLITPAISDVITAKYVDVKALALSMADKREDGFDTLYDILVQNKPVKLDEVTGVQNLELANRSAEKPSIMAQSVAKDRKDAGLDK